MWKLGMESSYVGDSFTVQEVLFYGSLATTVGTSAATKFSRNKKLQDISYRVFQVTSILTSCLLLPSILSLQADKLDVVVVGSLSVLNGLLYYDRTRNTLTDQPRPIHSISNGQTTIKVNSVSVGLQPLQIT